MSDKALKEKEAFFEEQKLLDISDDEDKFPDEGLMRVERALADSKAMPPPTLVRQRSSFLGPTPKERRAEFEAFTAKKRPIARPDGQRLTRSLTAPESDTKSFPATKPRPRPLSSSGNWSEGKLKKTSSIPDLKSKDEAPFYKRMGVIPRELGNGKNPRPAENIELEPEQKQLLRGKVVYFYPNNDVSAVRRRRIHKVIQLGAAWVNTWRSDITHIIVDDGSYKYSQLLHHLNTSRISRKIVLVKFDPYIPQCIQFGTLLEPTAGRFLVDGAPRPTATGHVAQLTPLPDSQVSLQVKLPRRQLAAQSSQATDPILTEASLSESAADELSNLDDERVKDSFIQSSSSPPREETKPPDACHDALSQAILETKAISHLPLDEDEGDSRPTSSAGNDSGSWTDEEPEPSPKHTSTPRFPAARRVKVGVDLSSFQCMDPGGKSSSQCPNARTIEVLEQMSKYYDQMQDQWRTLAYRKGITTLRKQTKKITTAKEAAALPFIGSRLADKIEEIVLTDRLRRLDSTRDDPQDQVLRLFLGVYGAGLTQANKWMQAGHRTLEDLVNNAKLTESQKVGIAHYDDFAARIPRAEVEAHGNIVKEALRKIDPEFQATIMGSYRRGAKDSGDIDLILTKPGASLSAMRAVVFEKLIPRLYKADFLKVSLATSSRTGDGTKWHGASCLPSSKIWRRLDLLLVPEDELGAALIYFTGNDIFNRSIRLLASKKGMRLNQRGLYKDVIRGKNREKLNGGMLVEGRDEKRIFEILGVPWREPTERIC